MFSFFTTFSRKKFRSSKISLVMVHLFYWEKMLQNKNYRGAELLSISIWEPTPRIFFSSLDHTIIWSHILGKSDHFHVLYWWWIMLKLTSVKRKISIFADLKYLSQSRKKLYLLKYPINISYECYFLLGVPMQNFRLRTCVIHFEQEQF